MSDRSSHSFMSWLTYCSSEMASHAASKLEGRKLSVIATDLPLNSWCHLPIWKRGSIFQITTMPQFGMLAGHYKVSRPVILLKLIDRRILKPTDYKWKAKKWKEAHESKLEKAAESKKSGGGELLQYPCSVLRIQIPGARVQQILSRNSVQLKNSQNI